ncbi:MAG: TldD/PmbA family protein [Candidatus Thorarchaeota archaeon]|nr:TldD/PmbA family protein [Candidatus Thorarchaeota archaeon]
MKNEHELLDLCKSIVTFAKESGADEAEAHAKIQTELESDIELAQISSVNQQSGAQIAIRVVIGKKIGGAFTNIASKEATQEAVQFAINAAKATTEDPDWVSLSTPETYSTVNGLWNDEVVKTESDLIVKTTGELIVKASEAEPGLILMGGTTAVGYGFEAYANSNGVTHSEKGTVAVLVGVAGAQTETGMTPMVVAYDIKRDLDLDLDRTVDELAKLIRLCKTVASGKTGKHTVVFHPQAYAQLLNYTLVSSIRGDNVVRGKSKIGDKIGDVVASDLFTLIDDGLNPDSVNTSIADDEGVPRRETPIIEKGVLRSFIWDTYWANKMGVKSTGNARRNLRQGLVEIASTSLVIEPGKREIEDIISEIKHGYYIQGVQGAHSANPESGDFSVVGNPAFLIEDGKLVGAINGLMVSGNAFTMLENVIEIAKTPHRLQSWIGPEIVCKDMDIIAKE